MKRLNLLGMLLAITLLTGCAGTGFQKYVDKQLGIPSTKEEMIAQNSDKAMAEAFSVLLDPTKQEKKDRTIDVHGVKEGSIELYAYYFIRFRDNINVDKFREKYMSLIEESQAAKIYLDVAKKRGNKIRAYKGDINYIIFGNDINVWRAETNGVSYVYTDGPTYIEFDKNDRIVSIMAYLSQSQFESNLPKANITKDVTFFIVTGSKAQAKQGQLTFKVLEKSLLFDVF